MAPSDLEAVLAIERLSFPSPWSPQFFLEEIEAPCARSLVCRVAGEVVGYIVYWVLPGDVDIHNIAVHPDYRRRKLGWALLSRVVEEAKGRGSERITLEVRKSNSGAQALYTALGFTIKGVRKGYYSDDGEDAWVMVLDLREAEMNIIK